MIAIYVDSKLKRFENKIKFTFDFIFNTLGYEFKYIHKLDQLQQNDILFYYGLIEPTIKEAYILAMEKILFFIPVLPDLLQSNKLTPEKIKKNTEIIKLKRKVPIISDKEIKAPIQYYHKTDLFYGVYKFDIVGNILFNLESSIKIESVKRDDHGWLSDEDVPFAEFHQEPYVNMLLWLIERCVKDSLQRNGSTFLVKKAYWPSAEVFAASFSYNVDKLQKWSLGRMISSIFEDILIFYKIKYVFNNFLSKMKYLLTNIEEYWNFDVINQIESMHQINSTFFFGTESNTSMDIDYSVQNNDVHKELMNNHAKGNEIALLASVNSGKQDILHKQKNRLSKITSDELMGIRHNHFSYDPRITHEFHKKNGFAYNSSVGFHHKNGFFSGLGFPFYQYSSHSKDLRSSFGWHSLELPIIFFDNHLKLSKSSFISYEHAQEIVDYLIESVESVNGFISFNYSISNFDEISYNKQLLNYTIEELRPKNVFIATLLQIAQWWKKREGIEIFESEDRFYLYFPSQTEKFTINVIGNYDIVQVNHAKAKIEGNNIHFSNIKLDSKIEVVLKHKTGSEEEK
jgi:hypothetical protein